MHDRLQFVAVCAEKGELDGVEIEDGSIYIARTKPTVPDAARLLARRLYGMLPRVRVTELMADVEQATGFAACFTRLRTGHPAADMPALLAAVLADAPILACRAWRTRRVGLATITWSTSLSGISARTIMRPPAPLS